MPKVPNVIIEMRGNKVIGVVADSPVRCVVVNHDAPKEQTANLRNFPEGKYIVAKVQATDWGIPDVSAGFVGHALKLLGF